MKKSLLSVGAASMMLAMFATGCATKTAYIDDNSAQVVAGFSETDISLALNTAVGSILKLNRIVPPGDSKRAIVIVENIINDTLSRGRDASALAEALGLGLREQLTDSGKIIVYNREAAQYAKVAVEPQYILKGRLTQRVLHQDDDDSQIEYNLNLQLIDLATGLEFWQRRVPIRKVAADKNIM